MKFHRPSPKAFKNIALAIAFSLGLTALLSRFEFNSLEAWFYDFRIRRDATTAPDSRLVLIKIDRATLDEYEEFSPLPLDFHARFMETMEAYEPLAIGYLINFSYVSQINPDLFQQDWGRRFTQSADRLSAKGIAVLLGTAFDVNGEVLPPYPLSSLNHSIALIHKDGNIFSEDHVTRRAVVNLFDKPAFHLKLTQMISGEHLYDPRGTFYVPEADGNFLFFKYHRPPAPSSRSAAGSSTYVEYSFRDFLNKKISKEALKGKIVLIGSQIHENPSDFASTPFSGEARRAPKLWVHANILDSFLNDRGVLVVPKRVIHVISVLLIGLVTWWGVSYTPLFGVIATFMVTLSYFLASLILFRGFGGLPALWLKESQPIFGVMLGYYLVVPFRLMREYRRRWDYQERNEILLQVEELKTNFLNLVTHDLKTPVARIQGLAEHVRAKAAAKLGIGELESLRQIIQSTDELNSFISSILELSKIETNRLQIEREQKDINQLVERAIESLQALAKNQGIELIALLEPLFPIRIDPRLIQKVLTNLIDNAIKYSPRGGQVWIETRERDEWVEISVRDQGIGLNPQEIENLFTRFYRAKNHATASTSGTGLGLYLTKYFVEAHEGLVEVQSQPGQGSTFKILLPMNTPSVRPGLSTRGNENEPKENAHV